MSKNLCAKTVTRENAYEVWQNDKPFMLGGDERYLVDVQEVGTWTWYVLKKYQSPENEVKNPYARWFCDVVTPIVPEGEMGDVYVTDITKYAKRIK
jgi:hypothetical protein